MDINDISDDLKQQYVRVIFVRQTLYKEAAPILGIKAGEVAAIYPHLVEERKLVNSIRSLYNRKGYKNVDFETFYDWFNKGEKECCYCGITQLEINQLFKLDKIKTSRVVTRGRKLELERAKPKESYENMENLRFSCYWCNNAKSDEFTEEEFKIISNGIKEVWEQRLKDDN